MNLPLLLFAQATETAGPAAIVTAIGGTVTALVSVWINSRKTTTARQEGEARLQAEVDLLRGEVERLRRQLEQAEAARVDRDHLMELMNLYGGRKLRRRLLQHDLGGRQ